MLLPEVDELIARMEADAGALSSGTAPDAAADRQCQLAELLKERGQTESAIAGFLKASAFAPGWRQATHFTGILFNELGRRAKPRLISGVVPQIEPDEADGHYNLGIVRHRQKRLPQAEACFQQTLRLRSDHVNACNNLGIVLHEQALR